MGKQVGMGTQLLWKLETAADAAYVLAGCIGDISGPSQSREDIDVTDHCSTANEFLPGMRENGTVSFPLIWNTQGSDPTLTVQGVHLPLLKLFDLDGVYKFAIKLPLPPGYVAARPALGADGSGYIIFSGYVQGRSLGIPVKGAITWDITLKVTGPVVILDFEA